MFSNIKIGRRLLLLIGVLTLTFMATGAVTLVGMSDMSNDTEQLNDKTSVAANISKIASSLRFHFVEVSQQLSNGALTWQEAAQLLEKGADEFERSWAVHEAAHLKKGENEFFTDAFGVEVGLIKLGFQSLSAIVDDESRGQLSLFLLNDAEGYSAPFLNAADALFGLESAAAQKVFEASQGNAQLYLIISVIVVIVGLLLAVTLGPIIYLSITSPIKSISGVVERVSRGDLDARTDLESKDEIGQLGNAFDSIGLPGDV